MLKSHFYILLLFFGLIGNTQNRGFATQLDSIQGLRKLSENEDFDLETRIEYAKLASMLSYKTEIDSIILNSNRFLAWVYSIDDKYFELSRRLNHKNLKLAIKLKDSLNLAYANSKLGYLYNYSITSYNSDSAYYYYYNSLKIFESSTFLKRDVDIQTQSMVFLGISQLQISNHDYITSQLSAINAINLLKNLPKNDESLSVLWGCYDVIGNALRRFKLYDKALEYYQKALNTGNELSEYYSKLNIYYGDYYTHASINMAELYKETGKYKETFKIYDELLEDFTLEDKDPNSYGIILNNMAYTMFLANDKSHKKIDSLFNRAYKIFDDLDFTYELSAGGNDMAEFYYKTNQKDKALYYSEVSYKRGKTIKEYDEVLRSLKMLSKLKSGDEGKAYLYKYIRLKDSLITNERLNRNKFARIQFETDQYIKETKRLTAQNILISVTGGVLVLAFGLLFFIKVQRSKNKALVLVNEQEKANQEIYRLMLQQQEKEEVGRLQERHRIAEDLHDGVLSKLFGTRMSMGFLKIQGDDETIKQYQSFMEEMKVIERDVRDVSHELKNDTLASKTSFELIIETYLKTQSEIGQFEYRIINKDNLKFETFNESIRVAIYRIIQEAVQNIIKHSKADMVTLCFSLKSNLFQITIEDDGIGFDSSKNYKGIGLKNIASRVSKIGGALKIDSIIDVGTVLKISIPNNVE